MSQVPSHVSPNGPFWCEKEWWIALGLCCLVLVVNLLRPMHHDNAVFQSMIEQWVKYGRKFLIGSVDQSFPGILYFHAISYFLFGTSEIGFRFVETSFHLAQAMGMYWLVRRSLSPITAIAAAVLSCELYMSGSDWSVGQRDAFVVTALVFATILFFRVVDRPRLRKAIRVLHFLAIGMLMGLVILLRPTYGGMMVWLGIVILVTFKSQRRANLVEYILGVIAAFVVTSLWFLGEPRMLNLVYYTLIRLNLDAYGTAKYGRTPWAWGAWKAWLMILIPAAAACLLWLKNRDRTHLVKDRTEFLLFAGYFAAAMLSLVVMGKYFRTHFEPLFQLTAILIPVTIERFFLRYRSSRILLAQSVVLLVGLIVLLPWKLPKFYFEALRAGMRHPLTYVYEQTYPDTLHGYRKQTELASYIRARTNPSDRVDFVTADPWLAYRTGLQLTSRFPSIVHLMILPPSGAYRDYQLEWQQEFVDSIATIRPKFFVTAFGPSVAENEFLPDVPYRALQRIPGYQKMLSTNYQLDTTIGWWLVYKLKP